MILSRKKTKESCNLIGQEAQLVTPNQKWQSQMPPCLVRNFMHKKQRKLLIYSRDIIDQRILQFDWKRHTYLHPTKSGSLRYYLTWWLIISMQKFKDINWNHPKILLIKQSSNLTWWERHTQPHPTKSQPPKLTTKRQFIFVMANKKEIIGN